MMLGATALLVVAPAEVRAQNYGCADCVAASGCWWCRLGDGQAANCGTPHRDTGVLSGFCDGGSCDRSDACDVLANLLAPEAVRNPVTPPDDLEGGAAPPTQCANIAARSRDALALTASRTRGVFELLR
jgi:hypothetical protein